MRKLKLSFATGPDGNPSSILNRCAVNLYRPLARIFQLSALHSEFLALRNISNYRGITSLCACSKLFEIIMNYSLFACFKNYIDFDSIGFYPNSNYYRLVRTWYNSPLAAFVVWILEGKLMRRLWI